MNKIILISSLMPLFFLNKICWHLLQTAIQLHLNELPDHSLYLNGKQYYLLSIINTTNNINKIKMIMKVHYINRGYGSLSRLENTIQVLNSHLFIVILTAPCCRALWNISVSSDINCNEH